VPEGGTTLLTVATTVTELADYEDDLGNRIEFGASTGASVSIEFRGTGNRLVVAPEIRLSHLTVNFNCDNGFVEIGPSSGVPAFSANMRVGQDARIVLGANVSSTGVVGISAVEGTSIVIGDDVMFASENQLRGDDGHPIFDIGTGLRVNPARDITIGDHVWVGWGAMLLGGTTIAEGCVVGMRSVVKGTFPNNCILVGSPARVVRRNVAWERPHLSLVKPYYKPDASTLTRSRYWTPTVDPDDVPPAPTGVRALALRCRRVAGRLVRPMRRRVRRLRRRLRKE
jgi:acetyltransferase-like isoleucine patch superfamily enzyme